MVHHVEHGTLALAEERGDVANEFVRSIDCDVLHWLVEFAVDHAGDDLGLTDGEFEAFATHGFNQNGELEFTAALNFPGIRSLGRENSNGDVSDEFLVETVLDHAGSQQLALRASQR